MSLLMDALRRAEANDSSASTDTETPVTEDTATMPASDNLQLEPMDKVASAESVLEETVDHEVANDADSDDRPKPTDAQRVAQPKAAKHSPVKKQAIYIFTGLATASLVLAAYYAWQTSLMIAPQVPHSATLVTAPEPSVVEAITATVSTVVVKPVQQAIEPETNQLSGTTATIPVDYVPSAAITASPAAIPATGKPTYKIEIHKRRTPRTVPSQLTQAYQAYQSKDYQQAEQLYRQALHRYPGNRDAMLGLAAIALQQGDRRVAHYYYSKILKTSPGDKTALLAIQALNGEQHQLEHGSQIKHWLQSERDSAPLHFALGNQHAANARWKEAQQSYFEAYSLQADNADYAFNLAISLDQLGIQKEALNYYVIAKSLAGSSASQFSSGQVDRRIRQLRQQTEQNS